MGGGLSQKGIDSAKVISTVRRGEDFRVSLDVNASRAVRVSRDVRVVWVW